MCGFENGFNLVHGSRYLSCCFAHFGTIKSPVHGRRLACIMEVTMLQNENNAFVEVQQNGQVDSVFKIISHKLAKEINTHYTFKVLVR